MPADKARLVKAVERNIQRIEKRPAMAPHHFTPFYPKSILGALRIVCWCGADDFRSMGMDTYEFARLMTWVNEHTACEPKEPTA